MAKQTSKKRTAKRGGKKGSAKTAKASKKKPAKKAKAAAKPAKKSAKPAKKPAKKAAKPAAKKPAVAKAPDVAWSDDAGAAVHHEEGVVEGGELDTSSVETSADHHPRTGAETTNIEGGQVDDDDFSMGQPLG